MENSTEQDDFEDDAVQDDDKSVKDEERCKDKTKTTDEPVKRKVEVVNLRSLLDRKKKKQSSDNKFCVQSTKLEEANTHILRIQASLDKARNKVLSNDISRQKNEGLQGIKNKVLRAMPMAVPEINTLKGISKRVIREKILEEKEESEDNVEGNHVFVIIFSIKQYVSKPLKT